jgi:hypothetical protein
VGSQTFSIDASRRCLLITVVLLTIEIVGHIDDVVKGDTHKFIREELQVLVRGRGSEGDGPRRPNFRLQRS